MQFVFFCAKIYVGLLRSNGRRSRKMVKIVSVENASLANKAGLLPGDILVSINKNEITDVLDYRFYLTERKVTLRYLRDGKEHKCVIKKDEYDDIGLEFATPLMDEKHSCKNGCIFCFIDQNPDGLRDSLYFKDDDSRLSFIHGNYITLTNMTDADIDRIVKMRFSPINISVHTTNPDLRVKMMKNKRSGEVLKYLKTLKRAGISMCAQIVLCKGVNDGDELIRTMNDLSEYFPELTSVAVVPSGLTKFRDKLFPLTAFTKEDAEAVIDQIEGFSEGCLERFGSRLFFPADEFYLLAERPLPDEDYYEGYPQIENGVGMLRSFLTEFEMAREDASDMGDELLVKRCVSVATGVSAYPMISELASRVTELCPNLEINVYKIINNFFGDSITVSGLLTGRDILDQLKDKPLGEVLFIPECSLRREEDDFLCGMTRAELSSALSVEISTVENDGYEFMRSMLGAE